ncbi:uncharacterized protein LOC112167436 isoform X1 [Rosa chinensis]|uniref:uncharacterized protein LOC112167436 isoform X1 n=1 Tax=Rosa chinensis TaxID=74649 RepID=UPI001AD8D8B9|nr:uncharacterized protein LOC112167436 isoform X1 [Rosa chinensis]
MDSGSVHSENPVQAEQETHTQGGKLKEKPTDQQGKYKDLKIYIEEKELIGVEPKEIYKFHLGPDDENLTLRIDKDLLIHIQGKEVRVVQLKEKFRRPIGSAWQGENPAQQINNEIHNPDLFYAFANHPAKRFRFADDDDDDDDTDLCHISDGPKIKQLHFD